MSEASLALLASLEDEEYDDTLHLIGQRFVRPLDDHQDGTSFHAGGIDYTGYWLEESRVQQWEATRVRGGVRRIVVTQTIGEPPRVSWSV